MFSVLNKIAERLPAELGDQIDRNPELADIMVDALRDHLSPIGRNPFEMSVEAQIASIRRANDEEGWGITDEVFARLARTAPAWPKGRHAFRFPRIRFGKGDEGVVQTFEAHATRIQHVFGEHYWRMDDLQSEKEHLRLLAGNHTHQPVVEWVTADLGDHRVRKSITDVRGSKSLADELLVVAWMFPDLIRAIDYDTTPGFVAAGYEATVSDSGEWMTTVAITLDQEAWLHAVHRDNAHPSLSVPHIQR